MDLDLGLRSRSSGMGMAVGPTGPLRHIHIPQPFAYIQIYPK